MLSYRTSTHSWAQDERRVCSGWTADNGVAPVHARFERFCGRFEASERGTDTIDTRCRVHALAPPIRSRHPPRTPDEVSNDFPKAMALTSPGSSSTFSPLVHDPLWRWEPARGGRLRVPPPHGSGGMPAA